MKRAPARGFAVAAGLITALMLTTLHRRNGTFEFCTTRAFGFPFPWWVDWCLCAGESDWPTQLFYWGANLTLASGAAAVLIGVARGLSRAQPKDGGDHG